MKTGIVLTARLGSTRLKRKHLLPVNDRPIIETLIERISYEFKSELSDDLVKPILCTSDEPENRDFEFLSKMGLSVFYGSKSNIPLRHLQAANQFHLNALISVDGDDILCSTIGMRKVYNALSSGHQYVSTTGLPFGMNSGGYSKDFLESSLRGHENDVLETGWGRIFSADTLREIPLTFPHSNELLRFTLDYDLDYQFFKLLIESYEGEINSASDEELVSFVEKNDLSQITEPVARKYWEDFNRLKEEEIKQSNLERESR